MSTETIKEHNLLYSIRRWLDKWPRHGELLYFHQARGRWRVIYPDGKRSQRFDYKTANDYRDIFGGEVIHVGRPGR